MKHSQVVIDAIRHRLQALDDEAQELVTFLESMEVLQAPELKHALRTTADDTQPPPSPDAPRPHWTQRPENAARLRTMLRRAAKTRRAHNAARHKS